MNSSLAHRLGGIPRYFETALNILMILSASWLTVLLTEYVFGLDGVQRHHVESSVYVFAALAAGIAIRREPTGAIVARNAIPQPHVILLVGFIGASWVLYGDTARLGLFSDDFVLLERARHHEWIGNWEFVRPVPSMLWTLTDALTGNFISLHALNITLHGLNAALVVLLGTALGFPTGAAITSGVLFLAYPINVEAIVWPASIHDVAVATCALAFILLSLKPSSAWNTAIALIVLLVGLFTKESAVAISVLAITFMTVRRTHRRMLVAAALIMVILYAILRVIFQPPSSDYAQPLNRYLLKELLARPIAALALPWPNLIEPSSAVLEVIFAVLMIASCAVYSVRRNRVIRVSAVVALLAAVFIAVLPGYSLLFISADLQNSRYVYLSCTFWCLFAVGVATSISSHRTVQLITATVAIGISILGVRWNLRPWHDAAALRERILEAAISLPVQECASVAFSSVPETIRGAYVFRNGLPEALRFAGMQPSVLQSSDCRFRWDGQRFQRQ